jgi:mutator protein MutT
MAAAVEVAAGLLTRDGAILACQRPPGGRHPGKWEFPGGKREAGESMEECLRRELREELGIEAEVGELVWQTEHAYPDGAPIALSFFAVRRFRGVPVNRAFAAIRWVDVAALAALDFLQADRELVERLARGELVIA